MPSELSCGDEINISFLDAIKYNYKDFFKGFKV